MEEKKFEIIEDDLLPNPFFEEAVESGRTAAHLDISTPQGKLWLGHCYRSAREIMQDPDSPGRLSVLANGFMAIALTLPREMIKEAVAASIEEIKHGKVGIPTPSVDSPEKLAEWRERIAARLADQKKDAETKLQ